VTAATAAAAATPATTMSSSGAPAVQRDAITAIASTTAAIDAPRIIACSAHSARQRRRTASSSCRISE